MSIPIKAIKGEECRMKKPDRSILNDIFGNGASVVLPSSRFKAKDHPVTAPTPAKKGKQLTSAQERFLKKLAEEDYHLFDQKDWIEYFKCKAMERDIKYLVGHAAKEQSIVKSLMNELHWDAIKGMIDFLFDSDQDIVDHREAGIIHLSKGWVNTIYQNSLAWREGKYTPKSKRNVPEKRNREWKEPSAASRKSSGTGISYGKPSRGDDDPPAESRKKVRF